MKNTWLVVISYIHLQSIYVVSTVYFLCVLFYILTLVHSVDNFSMCCFKFINLISLTFKLQLGQWCDIGYVNTHGDCFLVIVKANQPLKEKPCRRNISWCRGSTVGLGGFTTSIKKMQAIPIITWECPILERGDPWIHSTLLSFWVIAWPCEL